MKLYSATHFKAGGSASACDTPLLIADDGTLTDVGNLKWSDARARIEALKEGESTVCAVTMHAVIVEEGWRIRRLPDYAQGRVLWDTHAKEPVRVSNGKCVLAHNTSADFLKAHDGGKADCIFAPSEAIALRPILNTGGPALIAWTYRAVNPCDLDPLAPNIEADYRAGFERAMQGKFKDGFMGRV